jgi:YHS domain-containing protein
MNATQKYISAPLFTTCGGKITDSSTYPSEMFEGQRVYFCEESCRLAFLKNPERFMAGEIDHFAEGSEDA